MLLRLLRPTAAALFLSRATMATTTTPIKYNVQRLISPPTDVTHWPFQDSDLTRQDETIDSQWYMQPRFVTHIDEDCIQALSNVYSQLFHENDTVLDVCSSWISHFPDGPSLGNVIGLGMNEQELAANKRLSSYIVKDLNSNPTLPFENDSFDKVVNAVSVDYLCKPKEVFNEMYRVLKPGGTAIMSWSNRMFPTKVVDIWLRVSEEDRVRIVQTYFLHCGANFTNVHGYQMNTLGRDPLYVVVGAKPNVATESENPAVVEVEESSSL